jgi:alkylation response protein AidB-like acyl-CoA dehydrogenase
MDFSWTADQTLLKKEVIRFAQKELNAGLCERDQQGEMSRENWSKCADFGILGLPFPEEYGGSGSDILTTMLAMEGLGYGCKDNGLIFGLNAQMWSVQHPILVFGTEAQKNKYLPALCSGKIIGAHGMSEPDSGSDAFSLRSSARKVEQGYVLNGSKTFVSNGPVADVFVVFASLDRSKGIAGISCFLVERDNPGLKIGGDFSKMGLRTAPICELFLDECFVPDEFRLGPEGAGSTIFNGSMEWERSCILGSHVGAMERQLENCIRYARERSQFGKPIGKFQSVANRIADMKTRLETARLLLYKVAWLKKAGKSAVLEAAMAKLYLSECYVQSSLDAIRTFGGYGYMTEFEVERDLRDSIGGTLYSGTSDIQRVIISRLCGL